MYDHAPRLADCGRRRSERGGMSRSVGRRTGFGTRLGSGMVAGIAVAVLGLVQSVGGAAPALRIGAGMGARPLVRPAPAPAVPPAPALAPLTDRDPGGPAGVAR